MTKRGIAARTFLRNRPEKVIAVVSHAGFLRTSLCSRRFENADYRIFNFGEEEEADIPALIEWELTEVSTVQHAVSWRNEPAASIETFTGR